MRSIERRALVAVVAAVLVGLGAMALIATRSIASAIEREFDGMLKEVANSIAASSEFTSGGQFVLTRVPDQAEFDRQKSGWYWMVTANGEVLSRSRSLWTERLDAGEAASSSARYITGPNGEALRANSLAAQAGQPPRAIEVIVSAPASGMRGDIRKAVFQLGLVLGVTGIATIIAVALVLRRALLPLAQSAQAVGELTRGARQNLPPTGYREIDLLSDEINSLMTTTRRIVEQSRLGAANLAHALRTPLAALRARLSMGTQIDAPMLQDVARIERQIDHQLSRVRRVVGAPIAAALVPVKQVVADVALVVGKSHPDRAVAIASDIPDRAVFRGEREDLEELLSVFVDNAVKWADTRVHIRARQDGTTLMIDIDDDGPGIADDRRSFVVQPGGRLDEAMPGTGLGLSIAREIVALYSGTMSLHRSGLGGLCVRIGIPARDS